MAGKLPGVGLAFFSLSNAPRLSFCAVPPALANRCMPELSARLSPVGLPVCFVLFFYERVTQSHENPCFDGIPTYRQKYRLCVGMSR